MPKEQEQFILRLPDGQIFQASPERRANIIDKAVMAFEDNAPLPVAMLADLVGTSIPNIYSNIRTIKERRILSSKGWEISIQDSLVSLSKIEQQEAIEGYYDVPKQDMSPELIVARMVVEKGFPIRFSEDFNGEEGEKKGQWVRVTFASKEAGDLLKTIHSTAPFRAFQAAFLGDMGMLQSVLPFCVEWNDESRTKVALFGLTNHINKFQRFIQAYEIAATRLDNGEDMQQIQIKVDPLNDELTLDIPEWFRTSAENRYKELFHMMKLKEQLIARATTLNQGQTPLTQDEVPSLFESIIAGSIRTLPIYDEIAKFGEGIHRLAKEMEEEIMKKGQQLQNSETKN